MVRLERCVWGGGGGGYGGDPPGGSRSAPSPRIGAPPRRQRQAVSFDARIRLGWRCDLPVTRPRARESGGGGELATTMLTVGGGGAVSNMWLEWIWAGWLYQRLATAMATMGAVAAAATNSGGGGASFFLFFLEFYFFHNFFSFHAVGLSVASHRLHAFCCAV